MMTWTATKGFRREMKMTPTAEVEKNKEVKRKNAKKTKRSWTRLRTMAQMMLLQRQ